MRLYFIAAVLMLSGFTCTSTLAEFVITPTSVNATLGTTATFNCNATAGIVAWLVNGSPSLSRPDLTISNGGSVLHLHVPATEEYNNTIVTCVVFTLNHSVSQDLFSGAVLKVQGLLDAVSNLKSESLGPVIHLTWDAPFSLDITGVDHDIWYRVDITVDNDPFNNSSGTVPFNTYFVNAPEFNFTSNNTSTSVIYHFQITPLNGAGNGSTSAPVTGYFIGSPRSIAAEDVIVETSAEPLSVNFTITLGFTPPGETPDRFQVHAETTDVGDKVSYYSDDIPVTLDSDGMVFIKLDASTRAPNSSRLMAYRDYTAWIVAKNDFGESKSTGEIPFSTHYVQSCEANNCSKPGTVNITCNFTENSNAKGYLSVLCPKDNSTQEMFVIANRTDTSDSPLRVSVPGLPKNNFDVVVFDLGGDGLPPSDINYAAEEEENVTVIKKGQTEGDEIISVSSISLEVPDATNANVKLCVSFGPNTSSDGTVVLAHHQGDPRKLLRYNFTTNCTTAPPAGDYIVGVFTFTRNNDLREPATTPTLSVDIVPNISPVTSTSPTTAEIDPASPSLVAVAIIPVAVAVAVLVTALIGIVVLVKRNRAKKACMVLSPEASERITNTNPSVFFCSEKSACCWKKCKQEEEMAARIMPDSGTNPTPTSSCQPAAKPPLTYASLDAPDAPNSVPPIDMNVPYSLIKHDRKANQPPGIHYADLGELPGIPKAPPIQDDHVQYQTIKPPAQVEDPPPPPLPVKRHVTVHPPSIPVNLENLLDVLHPAVTSKWQQLGKVLGVDEDFIDIIFTNNEIDEECLKEILEVWIKKSSPTWKDVADALRKTGETQLAESLYLKHVLPGIVDTPPRTPSSEKLSLAAEEGTKTSPIEPPHQTSSSDQSETAPPKTLTKRNDTSCAPSKSPVVDEVPFQEPSPCVNHPSPESKVTDGNEVPPAENDTFAGEAEDANEEGANEEGAKEEGAKEEEAKEEESKGRNPSHVDERHAQKTLHIKPEKTDKLRTNPGLVAFSFHGTSREEVPFSDDNGEHLSDQADEWNDANNSTDQGSLYWVTSQHLCSHGVRMRRRQRMPLLADSCVERISNTMASCFNMPLREVARMRISQSDSLAYDEEPSVIYLSSIECISEKMATSADEIVGLEIGLGITVQDKDVEVLPDEPPCADETKVPQEGDVAVVKDPDEEDMAVNNHHNELHQGDEAVAEVCKDLHQAVNMDPHLRDMAVDNNHEDLCPGDVAVNNDCKDPHKGGMAVDNNHRDSHHKDLHQTNMALDEDRIKPFHEVVDHNDPCPRDVGIVDRNCKDPHKDVVVAIKDHSDSFQRDLDDNNCEQEMFGAVNTDHEGLRREDIMNDKQLSRDYMAIFPYVKNPHLRNKEIMKIHSKVMWQFVAYFRELFDAEHEDELWRDLESIIRLIKNCKELLQQDVDKNLCVPSVSLPSHCSPSLIFLIA